MTWMDLTSPLVDTERTTVELRRLGYIYIYIYIQGGETDRLNSFFSVSRGRGLT